MKNVSIILFRLPSEGDVDILYPHPQLGRLVSESACEREDPGSNPAADMVDAARNTAWDLGKQPNNYRSNYPIQEWARRRYLQSLSVEWAESGVRVNAVAPGSCIDSPTASRNYGEDNIFEQLREHVPAKRLGNPREVSSAVCFLLSPGASFISGATLVVDGVMGHYAPLLYRVPEHKKWPPVPSWDHDPLSGDSSS
ncbi:NAD(P)-binding domain [Trinorchestia longiramus]|nr:NAD(P)-binding domain [Trinorchestia longiramus]